MSAPLTAYHNKVIRDHTNLDDYLFCKFLAEYTDIGEHFYLDYIVKGKDSGVDYFIGGCLITSDNLKYHALARRGKAFDDFIIFTDGGLNTLGYCQVLNAITRWANYARINLMFKSAYYLDSTDIGYTTQGNTSMGSLAQKLSKNKTATILDTGVAPGQPFNVGAYIANGEGIDTDQATYIALEKIWYAGGAGMNTGNGNVWKLPSPTTPLEDSYLYNATGGLSESYFYLDEFIALDDLPTQGSASTETIIGYKDEQLGWGANNKFAEGYYYIYNTLETGIPQYGDSMGVNGKVFHVNSQGEFDYYIEREVAIPFVEVTATVSSSTQVEIGATMYIMDNGVKTVFNNNLGSNIVIIGGAAWYGSVTAGGSPSGAKLVGSSFTPSSFSLTIYQGNSIAFPTTCTINDLQDVPSGDPYIAMDTTSISPAPSSNTYVVRILADQYTY